jgi:hypothetical protein
MLMARWAFQRAPGWRRTSRRQAPGRPMARSAFRSRAEGAALPASPAVPPSFGTPGEPSVGHPRPHDRSRPGSALVPEVELVDGRHVAEDAE